MASTDASLLSRSDLNNFLFADVGVESSGMTLSVLSVLARLGMDPWQEVAAGRNSDRGAAGRPVALPRRTFGRAARADRLGDTADDRAVGSCDGPAGGCGRWVGVAPHRILDVIAGQRHRRIGEQPGHPDNRSESGRQVILNWSPGANGALGSGSAAVAAVRPARLALQRLHRRGMRSRKQTDTQRRIKPLEFAEIGERDS